MEGLLRADYEWVFEREGGVEGEEGLGAGMRMGRQAANGGACSIRSRCKGLLIGGQAFRRPEAASFLHLNNLLSALGRRDWQTFLGFLSPKPGNDDPAALVITLLFTC